MHLMYFYLFCFSIRLLHFLSLFFVSIGLLLIEVPWSMPHSTANTTTKTHDNATVQLPDTIDTYKRNLQRVNRHACTHPPRDRILFFSPLPSFFFLSHSSLPPLTVTLCVFSILAATANYKLWIADCRLQAEICNCTSHSSLYRAFRISYFFFCFVLYCLRQKNRGRVGPVQFSCICE